jgi:hypothetical protein
MVGMAKRLHQVVTIERTVQSDTERVLDQHQRIFGLGGEQNPMKGLIRTYEPTVDGGVRHPPQSQKVQVKASDMIPEIKTALVNLFNVKFTREYGNTRARADLVVGGVTLLTDVPTTYFLFLEDQVAKIRANIIARFPILDPSEEWHWDTARGIWVTEPRVTESTAKVPQTHVLYDATPQHPAQVRPWETDMKVGEWTTVKLSGQLPADQAQGMYDRCSKLLVALKQAREQANSIEVEDKDAYPVLDYIFGEGE